MDETRLELKVGALVAASLAALLLLLYAMGELTFRSGPKLTIDFAHTGNVVRGAPVKLGGVNVGTVEQVELLPERRDGAKAPMPVQMTVRLEPHAAASLREDASVTISTQGPLGEPYLEVWPGRAEAALSGSALRGVDAPRLDIVSNRLARFLEAASTVLENDPQALEKLVTGVVGLTGTVDGMLLENRADVRAIALELAQAAKELRALAAAGHAQLEPGGKAKALLDDASAAAHLAKSELPGLTKQAATALGGLAAATGQLDADDGRRLKETLARAHAASQKLDHLAARAGTLLTRLEEGEGTMGALMKDKQAYDELKLLLTDIRKHPWKLLWKE